MTEPPTGEDLTVTVAVPDVEGPVRRVAAGGWRRAVVGLAVGAAAGIAAATAMPRDGGRRV